jgi:hypothetical protein
MRTDVREPTILALPGWFPKQLPRPSPQRPQEDRKTAERLEEERRLARIRADEIC